MLLLQLLELLQVQGWKSHLLEASNDGHWWGEGGVLPWEDGAGLGELLDP